MCMFYGTPKVSNLKKPIVLWKKFKTSIIPNKIQFLVRTGSITLSTWVRATGGSSKGFHAFKKENSAKRYWTSLRDGYLVVPVQVKGEVFGEDRRGMRVQFMKVLKSDVTKALKAKNAKAAKKR